MDPDDISNITNSTDELYHHHENVYERVFLELFTLVGLISVVTNFLIVFVIVKYKKLREEVTNLLIVHLSILQAAYLFFTPLTIRVAQLLDMTSPVHAQVFCVLNEIEFAVSLAICLFLFLLVCDWYIKLYHEDTYTKFRRIYNFFTILIYLITGCFCAVIVQNSCYRILILFPITFLGVMAANLLLLVFVIVMNVIHAVKKRKLRVVNNKNNVGLVVANMFFLLWSPSLLLAILSFLGFYLTIFMIITITLGFSHSIFIFFYLFFYDNRFNLFLKQVLKCRCNDYENEELEDRSVVYNEANGVQITKNEENVIQI